ncbi:uncharacterized protein LOC142566314 [Dermacentor variabilis]|uniref:uncharacterized protein LOC142566314 n=1 Tax=Dermacentor variabilis TaxID=34621 RepID=UPI003F5B2A29
MAQDIEIASLPPDVREKLAELELELSEGLAALLVSDIDRGSGREGPPWDWPCPKKCPERRLQLTDRSGIGGFQGDRDITPSDDGRQKPQHQAYREASVQIKFY